MSGKPNRKRPISIRVNQEEKDLLNRYRAIKEHANEAGLDEGSVKHGWLKTKEASLFFTNPDYKTEEIDFEAVFDKLLNHLPELPKVDPPKNTVISDRCIYTDVHTGMDASRDGLALYAFDWNEEELNNRIAIMAETILREKQSDVLYLDDLGDLMDGWDGETTRKGHKLPQNMTNEKAYDVAIEAKIKLVEALAPHYEYITCNNICEDNHSGAFGYVVNSGFRRAVNLMFENVIVYNHRKFLSYYFVGKHAIVLTHGKDSRNLKFGFKPQLDPKQIEKIDQFLKRENIYKRADFIEFSKGDSHQCLFDMCSSDDFDYFNYPAFSPSSEWVQTNFKKGRSGFVIQHIHNEIKRKDIKPFWF